MKFEEFTKAIKEKLQENLGESYKVEIQQVRKNNDVLLCGLTIHSKETNIIPTIYLEAFYELYKNDMPMEKIITKIFKTYQESLPKENIDMNFFKDFEKVKDRIVYRLIHGERNKELLKDIPHIPFWDLAICFSYAFHSDELGDGMILIHNDHVENWNVNHSRLMQLAEVNTPKLFPATFYGINEVLKQMHVDIDLSECVEEQLYVLTNQKKIYGAASILYPGTLSLVAEQLKSDFYILPSSIHEVLILRKERFQEMQQEGKYLHKIIRDINYVELAAEEVLSDYPYFYDRTERKLVQICRD